MPICFTGNKLTLIIENMVKKKFHLYGFNFIHIILFRHSVVGLLIF